MAGRRFSHRISIRHLNVVLYLGLGLLVVRYWAPLEWAAGALPEYMQGSISDSPEREMYKRASQILREDGKISEARALLHRAIEIDPNCEAVYWLGEYYYRTEQLEAALEQFTRYVELDPSKLEAYLKISDILEQQGDSVTARRIMENGLDYFTRHAERYRPHQDDRVDPAYNQKAVDLYNRYRLAVTLLAKEMEWIERSAGTLR